MKLDYRAALTASMVLPLPVCVFLALESNAGAQLGSTPEYLLLTGALTSALLFVALLRDRRGPMAVRGWSFGALVSMAGVATYLAGSYYASFLLQWAGILVLYEGMVLYLGGREAGALVLPSALALVTIASPSYLLVDAVVEVALVVAASESILVLALRRSRRVQPRCGVCDTYSAMGESFCLLCGRMNGARKASLSGIRVLLVAVISLALVLASIPTVAAITSRDGVISESTYQLRGLASSSPLGSISGWNASSFKTTQSSALGVTTTSYNLTGKGEKVTVVVSTSQSPVLSLRAALGTFPGLVRQGNQQLNGSILANDVISLTNRNVRGVTWTEVVGVYNVTSVASLSVTYLGLESIPSGNVNGTGLEASAKSSALAIQDSSQSSWFLSAVVGSWLSSTDYIAGASAVFLICLPFEAARRTDSGRSRFVDNTLGLSKSEWESLAVISRERGTRTGSQIQASFSTAFGFSTWSSLEAVLLKFERLGLVEREIVTDGGHPAMQWRCLA